MPTADFNKLSRELSGKSSISGSFLLIIIIFLIFTVLIWSNFTKLDDVTRGQGGIESSIPNQQVQASQRGVLKGSYVQEGQKVLKGDLLFEIDPVDAKAKLEQAEQKLASFEIRKKRLNSEISDEALVIENKYLDLVPTVVEGEKALFSARKAELESQKAVLYQKLAQRNQLINEKKVVSQTAKDTLNLINEQISIIEPLVNSGLSSETELISLRKQATDFEGRAKSASESLISIQSSILEVEEEIKSLLQKFITRSQGELSEINIKIVEIESILPSLQENLKRNTVKAPLDGIVNQLNFQTLGGFVNPGDVLLEIVPTGDDLIVSGKIDPKDIAYIKPDQDVRITLTAYDSSKYGHIDGKVIRVSADAIMDQMTGINYYSIDVSINGKLFEDDGTEVELLPGMVATVDVLAGKRTILEYFWQPMMKVRELAFTD